jgi:hypothetical protein
MIEGYEKKVSQLREENISIKTKQKKYEDILADSESILLRITKFLNKDKFMKEVNDSNL